ncbi:MAG: hypothetical protein IPM24_18320 [Bryobacterales bacterium]|nr:hypothetical protein [Bryobacterales bacterium]
MDADLGNLYPVLAGISARNRRPLSYLEPQWTSLDQWKAAARPRFLELLHYEPPALELAGTLEHAEERDGFRVETVRITATGQYDIPARVLVPRGGGQHPGLLVHHCHSGRYVWGHEKVLSHPSDPPDLMEFRQRAYGRPYAEELARRGYVVVVIDAFYFGERRLRVEDLDPAAAPPVFRERLKALGALTRDTPEFRQAVNPLCGEFEHLTAKTIFTAGATWPGMHVWDDRRALDYLASRPEVDPARLGCLGLSIGGLRTAHLIAADPRLRVACVAGWMTVFHEQLRRHLRNHTWMIYVPGLTQDMDLPDAAALHAPGALLVQQCSRDALYPIEAMRAATDKLTRIYQAAHLPERFRGTFYDVPHSFTPEMQDEAFEWIARWI